MAVDDVVEHINHIPDHLIWECSIGQQLVEHHAQGVHIGTDIHVLVDRTCPFGLLRAGVLEFADELPGDGDIRAHNAVESGRSHAKVENMWLPILINQNV